MRVPAAGFARVLHPSLALFAAEGTGKAGWPLHPGLPRKKEFARARKPQVQAVTTGLPCAMVYGLYVISPVNHPVCHRRLALISRKAWRQTSGRQDHTTSPSAKRPSANRGGMDASYVKSEILKTGIFLHGRLDSHPQPAPDGQIAAVLGF